MKTLDETSTVIACASLADEEIVDIVLQKESEEEIEVINEEIEPKPALIFF